MTICTHAFACLHRRCVRRIAATLLFIKLLFELLQFCHKLLRLQSVGFQPLALRRQFRLFLLPLGFDLRELFLFIPLEQTDTVESLYQDQQQRGSRQRYPEGELCGVPGLRRGQPSLVLDIPFKIRRQPAYSSNTVAEGLSTSGELFSSLPTPPVSSPVPDSPLSVGCELSVLSEAPGIPSDELSVSSNTLFYHLHLCFAIHIVKKFEKCVKN